MFSLSGHENMKCNPVCHCQCFLFLFLKTLLAIALFVLLAEQCGLNTHANTVLKDAFDNFFCLGRHNHSSPLLRMLLLRLPLIEVV